MRASPGDTHPGSNVPSVAGPLQEPAIVLGNLALAHIRQAELDAAPAGVHGRIPSFYGAAAAATRLADLPFWSTAGRPDLADEIYVL